MLWRMVPFIDYLPILFSRAELSLVDHEIPMIFAWFSAVIRADCRHFFNSPFSLSPTGRAPEHQSHGEHGHWRQQHPYFGRIGHFPQLWEPGQQQRSAGEWPGAIRDIRGAVGTWMFRVGCCRFLYPLRAMFLQ